MDPNRVRARVRVRVSVRVRVRATLAQSCMLCGPLMSLPRVGISGCVRWAELGLALQVRLGLELW